jgi:hypothetical protein
MVGCSWFDLIDIPDAKKEQWGSYAFFKFIAAWCHPTQESLSHHGAHHPSMPYNSLRKIALK